jgi:hypothetical protein
VVLQVFFLYFLVVYIKSSISIYNSANSNLYICLDMYKLSISKARDLLA